MPGDSLTFTLPCPLLASNTVLVIDSVFLFYFLLIIVVSSNAEGVSYKLILHFVNRGGKFSVDIAFLSM